MTTNTKYTILRWVSIIILGVFFIISSYILKKEINNRTSNNSSNYPLFASKYLSIFTLFALIFSSLYPLFGLLGQFYPLCSWGLTLGLTTYAASVVFIGFYQLARLYYCFSQSQSYSSKGYSNKLFIFMYSIGAVLFLYLCIIPWYALRAEVDQFGHCRLTAQHNILLDIGAALLFVIWEWTTISLYVYKIWQFNEQNNDANKQRVWKRIVFILSKIIVLTLCEEVVLGISGGVVLISIMVDLGELGNVIWNVVLWFVAGCSSSLTSMIIYCIMEHNNDDYIRLLMIIEKVVCCACCKKLIRNATPLVDGIENEIQNQTKKNTLDTDDTKTRDLPRQLSPNHPSEYTETVREESLE